MTAPQRTYIAIDLKSFFASVECVERQLNPLNTNLVVADMSRTTKTICLAVSPSLKAYGIAGRARLFEVVQRVREVNMLRRQASATRQLCGRSFLDNELKEHPDWEVDYITAKPRMSLYIDYSTRVYKVYLKYIAPEDIHVYSIDEVFIDATAYLATYKMSAHELAVEMIHDVLRSTGITATAGIGTNMYLCKIAMDIVAKHIPADKDGVRIAELDEMSYRQQLWDYKPITKFWRIGHGIASKLARYGVDTMGKLARLSLNDEDQLYRLFGVNAELIIDHAWGWEPCTISEIKAYHPESCSLSNGQVLQSPYDFRKARVVVQEMAEAASLKLVGLHMVTNQLVMHVSYDTASLADAAAASAYSGPVVTDRYGRRVPKSAHGSIRLNGYTSSSRSIITAAASLYDSITNPLLLVRKLCITTNNVVHEDHVPTEKPRPVQLDLFTDYEALEKEAQEKERQQKKERRMQEAVLAIKKRFGKNAILRGLNFEDGATAIERNKQIGGHNA